MQKVDNFHLSLFSQGVYGPVRGAVQPAHLDVTEGLVSLLSGFIHIVIDCVSLTNVLPLLGPLEIPFGSKSRLDLAINVRHFAFFRHILNIFYNRLSYHLLNQF